MRIGTRLWLLLVATVLVVLSAGSALHMLEERDILGEALLRDRTFLGQALAASLIDETPQETLRSVHDLLNDPRVRATHVTARLVDVAQDAPAERRPRVAVAELGPLSGGDPVTHVTPASVMTYVPLRSISGGRTAIELTEPATLHADLVRTSIAHAIASAAVLAFAAGLIAWLIVRALVTRPLIRLGVAAREIARGHFDTRVPASGRDEVADFAREMNAMAERLALAQARLQDESSARVAALEALRHADRLSTVGQLASALAHELGTPLNVVAGHARLIERGDATDPADSARLIAEQTTRMANLIKTLLGFARRKGADRKPVALRTVAEKAVRMLEPIAHARDIRLEVEEEQPNCVAVADENQLLQVITNLVVNALQASPAHDQITVSIGRKHVRAPVEVGGGEGDYVQVSVLDNGGGIAPEVIDRLFEPFFTTKPAEEGTGLGLPVARGIAHDHGGWVSVDSAPGRGSRFAVMLPQAPETFG